MAQNNKRKQKKLEKKRRVERAKRAERANRFEVLPYTGNKYKTVALIEWLMDAEMGIYETFVLVNRQLTDHQMIAALKDLVLELRRGPLADLPAIATADIMSSSREKIVTWNIRSRWQRRALTENLPGRESLIGILRTILGTAEDWKSVDPEARGFIEHLEKFLTDEMGVQSEKDRLSDAEEDDDGDEDELDGDEDELDEDEDELDEDEDEEDDDFRGGRRPERFYPV